jgi:hypothetical protein
MVYQSTDGYLSNVTNVCHLGLCAANCPSIGAEVESSRLVSYADFKSLSISVESFRIRAQNSIANLVGLDILTALTFIQTLVRQLA